MTDSSGAVPQEPANAAEGPVAIVKPSKTDGNNNYGFVRILALIASLSGLLFGYDTGVVSGAILFMRSDMKLSDFQVEVVVASTVLAAAISASTGGFLLDSIGRKTTLVVASVIFVIGSLIMAFAFGPHHGYVILVLGRLIVGAAIGLAADAGPLYISECAPPALRGSLTTLFNVAVVGGQIVASVVCGCLSYLPPSYNWRIMLGLGAVPALAQMLGFAVLPRSPTWLVLKGRAQDAEQVLRKIRGQPNVTHDGVIHQENNDTEEQQQHQQQDDDDNDDPVAQELNDIIQDHEKAQQYQHVGLLELWRHNLKVRRAMILGCSLWAVSQLAGINTIMYYGANIVRRTGIFDGDKSLDVWITVPLSTMQLIGIFVCFAIIDRPGRRPTLLLSMTFVCISLFLIATGFATDVDILTVIAMFLYLFSFGVGLSTMPYTMNSEIYPEEYRGVCVAQATGVFWATNFIVSASFLTLARVLGNAGIFCLYGSIVLVSGVVFFFHVPETSGLSLHEIQALFDGSEEETSLSGSVDSDKEDYQSTSYSSRSHDSHRRRSRQNLELPVHHGHLD